MSLGFEKELEALLNRHSMENGSNTPDFILAGYLKDCLAAWNRAIKWRENWYGRDLTALTEPSSEDPKAGDPHPARR